MKDILFILAALCLFAASPLHAQVTSTEFTYGDDSYGYTRPAQDEKDGEGLERFSLSTNLLDWANIGTANAEASFAVIRRVSVFLGGRYNPWTLGEGTGEQRQFRQRTAYMGVRMWPWYVYSGWWVGAKAQVSEYNRGGFFGKLLTEEGVAYGLGAGLGYDLMVGRHWNVEAGAFFWGGYKYPYTIYACPKCGRIMETGQKAFIAPDDLYLSLIFVF